MLSITLIISSLWDESSCFLIQLTKSYLKFDLLKLKIHSSYDICFNALSLANTIYAIFFSLLGY